jgi:hypothetical protein
MLDGTRISEWDWYFVGFILPSGEFAECLTGWDKSVENVA